MVEVRGVEVARTVRGIVEYGSSQGLSTLHLAAALRPWRIRPLAVSSRPRPTVSPDPAGCAMMRVMKTALLFGASGFIGSQLLARLLASADHGRVTIVVRRDLGLAHPKLTTLVGDLGTLPALADRLDADDVFIAIGTTKKKVPDEAAYYRVDHDYPVRAAALAKAAGASGVFLVSAVGANAASSVFYLRTKGETECDVMALGFARTHVFRPSQLLGERAEKRPLERALIAAWPAIDWLLVGGARRYRGIAGAEVASAMATAARDGSAGTHVHEWASMKALAAR